MNKSYVAKNIGKVLRLRPEPWAIEPTGAKREITDGWQIEGYTGDFFALKHLTTGTELLMSDDNVIDYRADPDHDGFLILKAQVVIGDGEPRVIPKTHPNETITLRPTSLLREAYVDASLDCYEWKNAFFRILGTWEIDVSGLPAQHDVWDAMRTVIPGFSVEEFERWKPLFLQHLVRVRTRIDRCIQMFGYILPSDLQAMLLRGARQLGVEQAAYLGLPSMYAAFPQVDQDGMFSARFSSVIDTLQTAAREIERHARELEP
jgi:hypothetical protein